MFVQLPYIIPALGETKIAAEGRKDLYEWVARNVAKQGDQPVLLQLVKPISMGLQVCLIKNAQIQCHSYNSKKFTILILDGLANVWGLQDKFVDMRKSAEACLLELIRVFDVEPVLILIS